MSKSQMPEQSHSIAGREAIDPSGGKELYPVGRHFDHVQPYATSPARSTSAIGRKQTRVCRCAQAGIKAEALADARDCGGGLLRPDMPDRSRLRIAQRRLWASGLFELTDSEHHHEYRTG